MSAGIWTMYGMMKIGISVTTRACGKSVTYPASTPEIAPDAPIIGMSESGSLATCNRRSRLIHDAVSFQARDVRRR